MSVWKGVPSQADATLGDVVRGVVQVFDHAARERGLTLLSRITPEAAALPPMMLFGVISNAVKNAIDASGRTRGGKIEILARVEQRRLLMEILDQGPGPSEQECRRAFELGFTTKPSGSGIGLAVAADIVREQGGSLELVRRADGSGGCLRVNLPTARAEAPPEPWRLNDWGE